MAAREERRPRRPAPQRIASGWFDANHVRPQLAEQATGEDPDLARKVEHADVRQWSVIVHARQFARWHATKWPGRTSRHAGTSARHRSTASGQRVWKRHPGGGAVGLGISPVSSIR